MPEHIFIQFKDFLLGHEAHLHVQLGKFGLTVCPQVFIPKAAGDLVVAIGSGYHQQLLE